MGDGARGRVGVYDDGSRGESNLVQVKIFSGALGSGVRATAEAGEDSGSAGLLSERYMFSKAGVSFSVSPGLGWSVGTVARRTVEWPVGHVGREAVKTAELLTRHPLTRLKPGGNDQWEEFCLAAAPVGGEAGGWRNLDHETKAGHNTALSLRF